jgi:hypothetical protein
MNHPRTSHVRSFIAAAAITAAFAAPASAAVMGAADLSIKQLVVLSNTGAPLTQADILITGELRTGNASVDYKGVSVASPNKSTNVVGGQLDVATAYAGASAATLNGIYGGSFVNNDSFHMTNPTGNFALADMYMSGSAVTASGAAGLTRADASIASGIGLGGANTTISNSASAKAIFTVAQTVQAQFAISYDIFVKAFVGNFVPAGTGSANSTVSYNLTLRQNGVAAPLLSFAPFQLNRGAYTNQSALNVEEADAGWVFSDFVTLTQGKTYSLAINQTSNVTVAQGAADVPEPGTLFLSALGLLAAGAGARRRQK